MKYAILFIIAFTLAMIVKDYAMNAEDSKHVQTEIEITEDGKMRTEPLD